MGLPRAFLIFNRNFSLILAGQSASVLGGTFYSVVLVLYLKHMTGSATVLGMVELFSFLPWVLLGPLAGALVDRSSRKKVIVWCDLCRGLLMAILFVFSLDHFLGLNPVYAVFCVTLFMGVIDSVFSSALNTIIPEILPREKIQKGVSLIQGVGGALGMSGSALGGFLFATIGSALAFLLRGMLHLVAAFSSMFIVLEKKNPQQEAAFSYKSFMAEVKQGFLFIRANHGLRNQMFMYMFSNLFFPMVMLGLPFLIEDVLKLNNMFYGYLLSMLGLSSIVGYFGYGLLRTTERQNYFVICSIFFVEASVFFLLSCTKNVVFVFLLMSLLSLCMAVSRLINTSLKQKVIPAQLRGRVFGTENSINGALAPISFALGGVIIDLLDKNILLLFFIVFSLYSLLAVAFVLNRPIRRFYLQDT